MKALSVRQPWAQLIMLGQKAIELRNWSTNYRGKLAIHVSQKIDKDACERLKINPSGLISGCLIGIVTLEKIALLNDNDYQQLRNQHLSYKEFNSPIYGWFLSNPISLRKPIQATGQLKIFEVPEIRETETIEQTSGTVIFDQLEKENTYNPNKPFTLKINPSKKNNNGRTMQFGLVLEQAICQKTKEGEWQPNQGVKITRIAKMNGKNLHESLEFILSILQKEKFKATDFTPFRTGTFQLDEEAGVHLALLLLVTKTARSLQKIENIGHHLEKMSSEERFYWFSKCTQPVSATRAQKSLRILIEGGN